jgi:hypothetical protein
VARYLVAFRVLGILVVAHGLMLLGADEISTIEKRVVFVPSARSTLYSRSIVPIRNLGSRAFQMPSRARSA